MFASLDTDRSTDIVTGGKWVLLSMGLLTVMINSWLADWGWDWIWRRIGQWTKWARQAGRCDADDLGACRDPPT